MTAVVALRIGLDAGLVALVARARGRSSRLAVLGATVTIVSAVAMVSVLRTGDGRLASFLELGFQVVLVGLADYATYANPSRHRWLTFVAVTVPVTVLLLPAVVLYGEAIVRPDPAGTWGPIIDCYSGYPSLGSPPRRVLGRPSLPGPMGWGIRRRFVALLGLADSESTQTTEEAETDTESPDVDAEPAVESPEQGTPDGGSAVGLYECPGCARTYVSEGLDSCPQCGGEVDSIANERELGFV